MLIYGVSRHLGNMQRKQNKMATSVVCLLILCPKNSSEQRNFVTLAHDQTFMTFACAHHSHAGENEVKIELASGESGPWTAVDKSLLAGAVLGSFSSIKHWHDINFILYICYFQVDAL